MENSEIWKPVPGYEGLYDVSSFGRIRSLSRTYYSSYYRNGRTQNEKILRPTKNKTSGYMSVMLCDGKGGYLRLYIHRLVAMAFLPNPGNLPEVNHKDQNRQNNCLDNLEWCDRSYNISYGDALERHRNSMVKTGYAKMIYQYTQDGKLVGVYRNAEEAARNTGLFGRNIRYATSGKYFHGKTNHNMYRGYIWLNSPMTTL